MKLPWKRKNEIEQLEQRIQELEEKLEELREEKESYKERFQAEKERRSELARKKQEAEKQLKKLEQQGEKQEQEEEEETSKTVQEDISLEEARRILDKLGNHSSPQKDLATIYSPGKLGELPDLKGLKNSVSKEEYKFLSGEGFVAFIDPDLFMLKLKTRPFFSPEWSVENSFQLDQIREFIEERKQWAAVSAGETVIVEEEGGEILEREVVESRIERQQKKGGFSQGRFERKRDEQIEEHIREVEEKVSEDTLLVGEERLCKKLPGRYLGGRDSSRRLLDALYGFRLERGRV